MRTGREASHRELFRDAGVAVDCIAVNYWGKQKRKMVMRGINQQESNQQQ